MKVIRNIDMCHPILIDCIEKIDEKIKKHKIPIRLFETGRTHDRHELLIQKGKSRDIMSRHIFDMNLDPPLYATAVDYVYYNTKWSWNLRDETILCWYKLFGNLVLDICPELNWYGLNRKVKNYCHFQLRSEIIIDNIENIPCVIY